MKLTKEQRSARMKQIWALRKATEFANQKVLLQEMEEEKYGKKPDQVNHPSHYTFGKYEVIDVLQDWFPADPLLWQVGKYIARSSRKGKMLEDLQKARFYLERKISELEK